MKENQKTRIARYVATLMSDHNLENGSLILTAGTSTDGTEPSNGICKNEDYESCRGDNGQCKNYYGQCGGSANSTGCENVINPNMSGSSCGLNY